jgi:hypothetical protein
MTVTRPETVGLAYLATVYTRHEAGINVAFVEACTLAAKLIKCGVKCYSPIVNTHCVAMHGGLDPLDYSIWLRFDQAMMNAADVLIVAHMEGWQESFGIGEEIKFFEAAAKPIFDLDPSTLLMTRRKTSGIPRLEELRSILNRDKPKSVERGKGGFWS